MNKLMDEIEVAQTNHQIEWNIQSCHRQQYTHSRMQFSVMDWSARDNNLFEDKKTKKGDNYRSI